LLKERAWKYEEFLDNHPESKHYEDMRINLMVCIWKLVNPNIFDNMVDENFIPTANVTMVYEEILADERHPVVHEAVKGITDFIKEKDGPIASMENMDELYDMSRKLHDEASLRIKAIYNADEK